MFSLCDIRYIHLMTEWFDSGSIFSRFLDCFLMDVGEYKFNFCVGKKEFPTDWPIP